MDKKITELKVKLLTAPQDPIKMMWLAARNCYFKGGLDELEKTYDKGDAVNLLTRIKKMGHLSILEQVPYQIGVEGASRSFLAQMTRHRVGWSYAVQSQHYQKHNDFDFKELEHYPTPEHRTEYLNLMEDINIFYKKLIADGTPKYIAREVLPNATSVHLVMSANLSSLNHFWNLRLTKNNTPEIRKVAKKIYDEVIEHTPELEKILGEYKFK